MMIGAQPWLMTADLNVFTLNKRSVMLIHAKLGPNKTTIPIAFVAVGGTFSVDRPAQFFK
jgi:hypothetical protein